MAGIWSLYEEAKYNFCSSTPPVINIYIIDRLLDKRAVFTASFFGELD
jgi:hypothetical protein